VNEVSKATYRPSTGARRAILITLCLSAALGCGDDGDSGAAMNPQTAAGTGAAGATIPAAGSGTGTPAAGAPAAGSGAAGSAAAPGTGATSGATFTAVYDAIWGGSSEGKCVGCHGMPSSDSANGNLGSIMDKAALHAALVGKPALGMACAGKGMYVVPGSPETSLLVQKLAATPPCGIRMPLGGALSAATTKLVSDWITAGAKND
jgi:hypothetical protein